MHLFNNIKDLILDICCKESREVVGKMAILLCIIWQNRNNYVWNEVKIGAQQAAIQAENMWNEWAIVNGAKADASRPMTVSAPHITAGRDSSIWQPPTKGFLKCNVDASFFDSVNAIGWGWYLRDHQGRFMMAGANIIQARLNTIEGEAMSMKEAISELI
jgi:hypothetical protein